MRRYAIRYYTSGGYKASGVLDTNHTIERNPDNSFVLKKEGKILGGVEMIEQLFLKQLGYVEDITIVGIELES